MKTSKCYTALLTIGLMLFILSGSIAVPLLWRPFYYFHISALRLPELTGYTAEQIRTAFDQMMDFCMYGAPFGTGDLRWSVSGMEHFADCAVLFRLDLHVLILSSVLLAVCAVLYVKKYRPVRVLGRGPFFWAGSVLAVSFLVIAGMASVDFYRAFVTFHHLFFPGKSNWIFDPSVDEIINVLPEVFFMNCAILIVVVMFVLCAAAVVIDFIIKKKGERA
jgi:integral membrane protein (TIGR01906 family)